MQPINEQTLANWLSRLVQIPSVSPQQAGPKAGLPGEARIGDQVAAWFRALGGEVSIEPVLPGRPNVYGIWRGRAEHWLAVDVHLDTVGVEQMSADPFSGLIANGRVYGRGAVDDKASLAVVLGVLEAMHQTGQRPAANLLIAATADEEVGATGAPAAARWIRERGLPISQMIVAEPTLCTPIHGHKGVVRLAYHIQGKATHSSQPHLGQNAVVAAAHLVTALQAEQERLQQIPPQTALGPGYLTVTLIQGGVGINIVPDACHVSIDRRVIPGEMAHEVSVALAALGKSATPLPLTVEPLLALDAFYQPLESPLIRQLSAWSGQMPAVAPYGTNAWAYADVCAERVVFGPGSIDQAHGAEEWVEISELAKAAEIYARWWGVT